MANTPPTSTKGLRILIVDDEPDLLELIEYNLTQSGYQVTTANNGTNALQLAQSSVPDLIVLDVMMPELNGIEVAKRLRTQTQTSSIPIIMLTAKAEEVHELQGLDAGADDYITKPFSMQILLARIQSLARRSNFQSSSATELTLGAVAINLSEHQVFVDGVPIQLTITEFRLLATLIGSADKVITRAELISKAIGPGVAVTQRTIDVHITAIRRKLGDHADLITTVRGVGYRAGQ